MPVVKKSVAVHPIMDKFVRKTWSLIIEDGYDATYSTALNSMLLGAVLEATKEGGWSDETRRLVWNFIEDKKTVKELNLEDRIANIREQISLLVEEEEQKILKLKRTRRRIEK